MTDAKRIVWVVTPHYDPGYDEWWGPAETEEDHMLALDAATRTLASEWKACETPCDPRPITIEKREVTEEEYQENRDD